LQVFWLVFFLLLNNVTYGGNIDFPVEACIGGVATGNYGLCIAQLVTSIFKLHNWNEDTPIDICGIKCNGNVKGRLSKWQWKWDGHFRCETKAPGITGHATKQSKNGAMEWDLKDFLNKAIRSGQLKPQDFQC
jgi:hypothetical protein